MPGNEALVAAAVAEGHELGNHLTRDEPSNAATRRVRGRVREADSVLALRHGAAAAGSVDTDVMLDTIEHEGHRCALGSIYPYDAQQSSARLSASTCCRTFGPEP